MSDHRFTNQRWSVTKLPKDLFAYFENAFPVRENKDDSHLDVDPNTGGMRYIAEADDKYPRRAIHFLDIRSARYERRDTPEHAVTMEDVYEILRSAIQDITDLVTKGLKEKGVAPPHVLLTRRGPLPRVYADRQGEIVRIEAYLYAGVDGWTSVIPSAHGGVRA